MAIVWTAVIKQNSPVSMMTLSGFLFLSYISRIAIVQPTEHSWYIVDSWHRTPRCAKQGPAHHNGVAVPRNNQEL